MDDDILMNYPVAEQRCIRCHAGPVADCRCLISYSQHDSASSLDFWIALRLPIVKIGLYYRPLRVVSLSNHDFYPPIFVPYG
jgi:hypothetical protein